MKKLGILFLLTIVLFFMGCPTDAVGPETTTEAEDSSETEETVDTSLDDSKEIDFSEDLNKFGQDSDANWFEGYAGMDSGVHLIPGDYGMTSLTVVEETTDGADKVAAFDFVAKEGTDGTGAAVSFDADKWIKIDLGTSRFQWDSVYGAAQDFTGKTVSLRMNVPQGYIDAGLAIKLFLKDTAWSSLYPDEGFTLVAGWQTYTLDLTSATGPDFSIIDILGLNIALDGTTDSIDLDTLVALDPILIDWINWE